MKRIILVIVAIISLVACNQTKEKKNDLQRENLKGKVKSVKQGFYEAFEKFGEIVKGEKTLEQDGFNYSISYNEEGHRVEEVWYNGGNRGVKAKFMYKYNDSGLVEKADVVDGYTNELFLQTTYKYDEKGNQIEENWYKSNDGSLVYKILYKYDEKGNQIEKNEYNSDGSLDGKITYEYDSNNNLIQQRKYNSKGKLWKEYTYTYEFDTKKNWIKRIEYENNYPKYIFEREIEYYK